MKKAGSTSLSDEHTAALELAVRQALMSRNSGCMFARVLLAREDGPVDIIMVAADLGAMSETLDAAFDDAAAQSHVAIALFPEIETMDGLVGLLTKVSAGNRWSLREVAWKANPVKDHILVGIDWRTSKGKGSSIMGLAPFSSTPIYRQVPCVGMALWPGGEQENEHWKTRSKTEVGLVLTPTGLSPEQHAEHKAKSREMTKALRSLPGSYAAQPDVAFVVPSACKEHLVGKCNMVPLEK